MGYLSPRSFRRLLDVLGRAAGEELSDDFEESWDGQADVFELLGACGVGEESDGNADALDAYVL